MATKLQFRVLMMFLIVLIGNQMLMAADWPNYRGPDHNGITSETNWSSTWPEAGPKKLWTKSLGIGFSSITVANGRVYTTGNTGKKGKTDIVFCFDAKTGQDAWTHAYPCALEPKYYEGGTLSTPTVDAGKVYVLSKMGDLFCLDAAKGTVIWQKQLNKAMGYELPTWHFSSSPLIVDDMLILNIGDAGLALNKNTGALVWENGKGKCGYSTPMPFAINGKPGLAIFGMNSVLAVSPTDGKKLWQFEWKTKHDVNAADPIVSGNKVFISSGYGRGCALLEINGSAVDKVWENKAVRAQMNCLVLQDGYLYGFDDKILKCVKMENGAEQWQDKSMGKGALMMSADGRLIIMSDKSELVIARANPDKLEVLARSQVLPKAKCWTTPVLANGRIYARNTPGDFVCIDVSQ
jgi:outer membrane protein assembly factor BamB